MVRGEVVDCKRGYRLGHLFDDGPSPTAKYYCINSVAFIFSPEGGKPEGLQNKLLNNRLKKFA